MAEDLPGSEEGEARGAGEAVDVVEEVGDGGSAGDTLLNETVHYWECRHAGWTERLYRDGGTGESWLYERRIGGRRVAKVIDRESGWEKLLEWGFV